MRQQKIYNTKGERVLPLRGAATLFPDIRCERIRWDACVVAYVCTQVPYDIFYMAEEERGRILDAVAARWTTLTEDEKRTHYQNGGKWQDHPYTQNRIQSMMRALAKTAGITLERNLAETSHLAYSRMSDYVTWDENGVKLRPMSEISDEAMAAVQEVTDVWGPGGVHGVKLKLHGKTDALTLLQRYLAPEKALALTQNNLNINIHVVDGVVVTSQKPAIAEGTVGNKGG